jgi:hypothetical protein
MYTNVTVWPKNATFKVTTSYVLLSSISCGHLVVLHLIVKSLIMWVLLFNILPGNISDPAMNDSVSMTNVIKYKARLTSNGMIFVPNFTEIILLWNVKVLMIAYNTQKWDWLRLSVFKGPNRVGAFHSPEDWNRSSFRNVVFSNF